MADYGREWTRRPRRRYQRSLRGRDEFGYGSHRPDRGAYEGRRRGRSFDPTGREMGIEEGFGYGAEAGYGMEMMRGRERGYRTERGYETMPGYETERGYRGGEYGRLEDYGERHIPGSEFRYDYEFTGQWPRSRYYRGGGRQERIERHRAGPSGLRRARERTPLPMEESLYGREFVRHGRGRRHPSGRYGGMRSRYSEEFLDLERAPGEEYETHPRYGHTPGDRWPDTGHDLDALEREELEMGDGKIREAVLENLFQDSWIDPERIDVDVDDGVVTLTGEVRDFMEARYAWDDAWETAGVRGVVNNLTVRADLPGERMEMPQTAGERGRGRS